VPGLTARLRSGLASFQASKARSHARDWFPPNSHEVRVFRIRPEMGWETGDGSLIIEIISLFGDSAALADCRAALKTHYNQPHAPRPTAVLLSCRHLLFVSVRFRHFSDGVQYRPNTGSFVHGRFSGGIEAF